MELWKSIESGDVGQEAVLEWLGEARTEALQAAAAELVVDLAVAGFFCPARYLNTLLARVWLFSFIKLLADEAST